MNLNMSVSYFMTGPEKHKIKLLFIQQRACLGLSLFCDSFELGVGTAPFFLDWFLGLIVLIPSTRWKTLRTWSESPCFISRSSNTFHRSMRLGKDESRPSNKVRPLSTSPFGDRNSSWMNLQVTSTWVSGGNDCIARGRSSRPRSGLEIVSKRKFAKLMKNFEPEQTFFLRAILKSSSAF